MLNLPPDANLFAEHLPHLLPMLAAKGPEHVVVTGVHKKSGGRCVCYYHKANQQCQQIDYIELPISYPGTGDIFAAVLVGGLLPGTHLAGKHSAFCRFYLQYGS